MSTSSDPKLDSSSPWQPRFVSVLVGCLLGGLVGGLLVQQLHPLFPNKELPPIDLGASAELVQQHREAASEFRSNNYGAELAIVGLALGLAFGAVSGGRKRILSMIVGGLAGAIAGFAGGFFGGRIVAHALFQNQQQTLQASMGLQAVVWSVMIASIVWVVATANVGAVRALHYGVIGLLAGVAVAATQFVVSSFMFPVANPQFLVPEESKEQLYWLIAYSIVVGLCLGFGLSSRGKEAQALHSSAEA